jgi:NAD(P)-dependent dehydrogenase (short-subunit alcohol dehydrogenase family)
VRNLFDINLRGAVATLLAAIPIMVAQKSGHLVAVTSLAGRRGLPMNGPYCASKAAVTALLDTMRIDLAPSGIRVTDIQPGFGETPMTNRMKGKAPMPFMWPVERAARYLARRLERAPATIAFPWQLAWLTSISRVLPAWLYDRVLRAQVREL